MTTRRLAAWIALAGGVIVTVTAFVHLGVFGGLYVFGGLLVLAGASNL